MARNDEIEAGVKAIVEDLVLPGGRRKKLARVVERHLAWFDAAEARGMTWDDMIAVLAAAGGRRGNGLPFSRGTLSSAVWRKRKDAAAGRQEGRSSHDPVAEPDEIPRCGARPRVTGGARSRPTRGAADRGARPASSAKSKQVVGDGSRGSLKEEGGQARGETGVRSGGRRQKETSRGAAPERRGGAKESASASGNLLAYMKRAVRLRQRSGEEN